MMNHKLHWQAVKDSKHASALVFIIASIMVHAAVVLSSFLDNTQAIVVTLPTQTRLQISLIDNAHKPAISGTTKVSITAANSTASVHHHSAGQLKQATERTAQLSPPKKAIHQYKQLTISSVQNNLLAPPDTKPNAQATIQESSSVAEKHYGTDHNNIYNANNTVGSTTSTSAANPEQSTAINQKILKLVHNELQKYIVYPIMARQRGWAGLVLVGFQFNDAGLIRNIHLSKSSGYPILDQSALSAFQHITDTQFVDALRAGHWQVLQLPIEFRLVEG